MFALGMLRKGGRAEAGKTARVVLCLSRRMVAGGLERMSEDVGIQLVMALMGSLNSLLLIWLDL